MIGFMSYSIPRQQAYEKGINTMLQVLRLATPEFKELGLTSPEAYQFVLSKVILDPSWKVSGFDNTEKLVLKVTEEVWKINQSLREISGEKPTETQVFTAFKFNEAGLEISKENFEAVSRMQDIFKREGLSTSPDIVIGQLVFINTLSGRSGVISRKDVNNIEANLKALKTLYTSNEIRNSNLVATALYLAVKGQQVGSRESIKNTEEMLQRLNDAYEKIISLVQKNRIDPNEGQAIFGNFKNLSPKEIISLVERLTKEDGKLANERIDQILSEIEKSDPQGKSAEAKKSDPKAQTSPLSPSVSEKRKPYKSATYGASLKEKHPKKKDVRDEAPAKSFTEDEKAEKSKK